MSQQDARFHGGQDGPQDGTHGGTHAGATPDFSGSVMRRLGYERVADQRAARRLRTRRVATRAAQAAVVLAACTLGLVWWWTSTPAAEPRVAVGDALRGSFAQGAGQLDGLFAAMPRAPMTSVLRASNEGPMSELPSATLENAPQLRSY